MRNGKIRRKRVNKARCELRFVRRLRAKEKRRFRTLPRPKHSVRLMRSSSALRICCVDSSAQATSQLPPPASTIRKKRSPHHGCRQKDWAVRSADKSGIRTHAREDCGGCLERPKRSALDHSAILPFDNFMQNTAFCVFIYLVPVGVELH